MTKHATDLELREERERYSGHWGDDLHGRYIRLSIFRAFNAMIVDFDFD